MSEFSGDTPQSIGNGPKADIEYLEDFDCAFSVQESVKDRHLAGDAEDALVTLPKTAQALAAGKLGKVGCRFLDCEAVCHLKVNKNGSVAIVKPVERDDCVLDRKSDMWRP